MTNYDMHCPQRCNKCGVVIYWEPSVKVEKQHAKDCEYIRDLKRKKATNLLEEVGEQMSDIECPYCGHEQEV